MPRVLLVLFGLIAALLVASQLALPPLAERKVEDRLQENGGTASVELGAFPALRLLFDDGDSFESEGRGVRIDVTRRQRVFERLDGFDEVRVRLLDSSVGPFELQEFELTRAEGERGYRVELAGEAAPRDVASFLGSQAGGPLGGLLGALAAGQLLGGSDAPLPMRLNARVESRDGQVEVTSTTGSVAGVPAGPLAQIVIEMVVRQL
jgi:hypothetical protein